MKAPDALREAALHPRPERILGFERGRLLTLARSLDRLVVHLRPDRALPWGVFRGGAYLAGRTGATGGPVKRIRNTGSPETSCPGVHLTLVCPWGQCAGCASQSKTKA